MKTLSTIFAATLLSSVAFAQAPAGTISTKDKKSKDYASLATVTLQEAVDAALVKVPGKAVDAELDSEKGFLVYEVKVVATDNTTHEVTVDAGNKAILKAEAKKGMFK
ncbi:MAG: PepSY domain-containing protein [Bdellovibrionota bacterium]|nr:MAG: hypothetical protein EOP10_12205 [Pseudomonadota bacterium]